MFPLLAITSKNYFENSLNKVYFKDFIFGEGYLFNEKCVGYMLFKFFLLIFF